MRTCAPGTVYNSGIGPPQRESVHLLVQAWESARSLSHNMTIRSVSGCPGRKAIRAADDVRSAIAETRASTEGATELRRVCGGGLSSEAQ